MGTHRSYYLACKQDDSAQAPADTRGLNSTKSCTPRRPTTIRDPNVGCRHAAGRCFVAWSSCLARLAKRSPEQQHLHRSDVAFLDPPIVILRIVWLTGESSSLSCLL